MKLTIIFLLICLISILFACNSEKDIREKFNMNSWLTIDYGNYIQKVEDGYISEIYTGPSSNEKLDRLFISNTNNSMDEYYLNKHNNRQEEIKNDWIKCLFLWIFGAIFLIIFAWLITIPLHDCKN